MNLYKTSVLNSISVFLRMVSLFFLNKILAVHLGPVGYAAIGNFQNVVQMIFNITGGAMGVGISKLTSEYHLNNKNQHRVWSTAVILCAVPVLIFCLVLLVFAHELAIYFIGSEAYYSVFYWLSFSLIFMVLNSIVLAIFTGKGDVAEYVIANIFGSIFALVLTSTLVFFYQLYGALLGLCVFQSLTFVVTLYLFKRKKWFGFEFRKIFRFYKKSIALNLSKFFVVALISASSVPVASIFIRKIIVINFGKAEAGIWEAINRLSGAYLLFITTILLVYFVPRISKLTELVEIKKEISTVLKFIFPPVVIVCIAVYFFRDIIAAILFSSAFTFDKNYIFFQLCGDLLKVIGFVFSYCALGKGFLKLILVCELFCSLIWVALSYFLSLLYGLDGVYIAYFLTYMVFCLYMFIGVSVKLFGFSLKNLFFRKLNA